ncbi:hypothetical protein F4677DRAFT_207524 [Hypoxylon crocopeplum]|nr:hypothetical protein F4677DRAFT_207524 [Hypoxylon crocopeplum]
MARAWEKRAGSWFQKNMAVRYGQGNQSYVLAYNVYCMYIDRARHEQIHTYVVEISPYSLRCSRLSRGFPLFNSTPAQGRAAAASRSGREEWTKIDGWLLNSVAVATRTPQKARQGSGSGRVRNGKCPTQDLTSIQIRRSHTLGVIGSPPEIQISNKLSSYTSDLEHEHEIGYRSTGRSDSCRLRASLGDPKSEKRGGKRSLANSLRDARNLS